MGGRFHSEFSVSFPLSLRCSHQSQSATDTIIEKIYQSEIRVREHVDTKIEGVNTKISEIDKKVGPLSTDVKENKTNITNMKEDIRDLKGDGGFDLERNIRNFGNFDSFYSRLFFSGHGGKIEGTRTIWTR